MKITTGQEAQRIEKVRSLLLLLIFVSACAHAPKDQPSNATPHLSTTPVDLEDVQSFKFPSKEQRHVSLLTAINAVGDNGQPTGVVLLSPSEQLGLDNAGIPSVVPLCFFVDAATRKATKYSTGLANCAQGIMVPEALRPY